MLLKITKDVVITVNPCLWFSSGLIVGKIIDDDHTFLTVITPYCDKPITLPKDCVEIPPSAVALEDGAPPTHCDRCGHLQPEPMAVWLKSDGRYVCLQCHAAEDGPVERYELDPQTNMWVRTYPE